MIEIFSLIKKETDEALKELSGFGEAFGEHEAGNDKTV